MTWFKVDDGFWSNPKTLQLSGDAGLLWVRAGSYSCQHLTDGIILRAALRLLGTEEAAAELVSAGLWSEVEGGYEFHDWDEYQETSVTVRSRREQARDRQRRAREASANKRRESQGMSRVTDGVTPESQGTFEDEAEVHGESQGMSRVTDGVTHDERHAPVTGMSRSPRPDPTRPDLQERAARKKPATRLPDDWVPTDKHSQKAREKNVDLDREAEAFRNHAEAADRRIVNWNAAFSNWLLNARPRPRQEFSVWDTPTQTR